MHPKAYSYLHGDLEPRTQLGHPLMRTNSNLPTRTKLITSRRESRPPPTFTCFTLFPMEDFPGPPVILLNKQRPRVLFLAKQN